MANGTRPRSPFVAERDTSDGGFSRGWGLHFLPSEEYWIDMHTHLTGFGSLEELRAVVDQWFDRLEGYRLGQIVTIVKEVELFDALSEHTKADGRFAWLYWPDTGRPDPGLAERALKCGAVGFKLHNDRIMTGEVPPDVFGSQEWRDVFSIAEDGGLPLLWHVTQRKNYSPYHGGGLNAYWSEGEKRGVTVTNEKLLQGMLDVLKAYKRLKVVGAHQLHLGPDRLAGLLGEHLNLYIDTSCGFYLRWADEFIEEDRVVLNGLITKYADRIMYGTDSELSPGGITDYLVQGSLCHARFLHKLWLDHDTLQKVAWKNAKGLFRLPPCDSSRRGNVRP